MLMSTELYYEANLKNKSEKELLSIISSLKKDIDKLKDSMENPYRCEDSEIYPSESVQLQMAYEYLEEAKNALAEAGGTYTPTKAELKAMDFTDNIENISKITFTAGTFAYGSKTTIYDFTGDEPVVNVTLSPSFESSPKSCVSDIKKESFFAELLKLRIGEWRTHYTPDRYGIVVYDGTHWTLLVEYSDGHRPVKKSGNNAYPYNFDGLCNLIDSRLTSIAPMMN